MASFNKPVFQFLHLLTIIKMTSLSQTLAAPAACDDPIPFIPEYEYFPEFVPNFQPVPEFVPLQVLCDPRPCPSPRCLKGYTLVTDPTGCKCPCCVCYLPFCPYINCGDSDTVVPPCGCAYCVTNNTNSTTGPPPPTTSEQANNINNNTGNGPNRTRITNTVEPLT